MKYEVYTFTVDASRQMFEFDSIGSLGCIRKKIAFGPTERPLVFNLAFGDVTENNEIDDFSVSNNGDRNKILATVVSVIDRYTVFYPDRWIYIKGSTIERTRLYRMVISIHLEELTEKFEIYGESESNNDFSQFYKDMKVIAFLIKRKIT